MPERLNIQAELAAMDAMTPKQLREKYLEVYGDPTRSGNRRFMIKRIAWRLQANEDGDLPDRVRQKALDLARDSDLRTTAPPAVRTRGDDHAAARRSPGPKGDGGLMVGTQLTRIYKGRTIVATVLDDGFAYAGKKYRSLSAVAKVVTGTHISGHAFFGLTERRRKETAK